MDNLPGAASTGTTSSSGDDPDNITTPAVIMNIPTKNTIIRIGDRSWSSSK